MGPHLPTSFCHQGLHPQAQLGEGAPLGENHTPWGPVGACLSQRILGVFWVEAPMPVVGWQLGRYGNQSAGLWGLQCQQTAPSPAVWCPRPACELRCLTHCPRGLAMEQGGTGLLGTTLPQACLPGHKGSCPEFLFPQPGRSRSSVLRRDLWGAGGFQTFPLASTPPSGHVWASLACQVL